MKQTIEVVLHVEVSANTQEGFDHVIEGIQRDISANGIIAKSLSGAGSTTGAYGYRCLTQRQIRIKPSKKQNH